MRLNYQKTTVKITVTPITYRHRMTCMRHRPCMQLGAGFRRVLILPLTALVGGRNVAARLLPEEVVFDGQTASVFSESCSCGTDRMSPRLIVSSWSDRATWRGFHRHFGHCKCRGPRTGPSSQQRRAATWYTRGHNSNALYKRASKTDDNAHCTACTSLLRVGVTLKATGAIRPIRCPCNHRDRRRWHLWSMVGS